MVAKRVDEMVAKMDKKRGQRLAANSEQVMVVQMVTKDCWMVVR